MKIAVKPTRPRMFTQTVTAEPTFARGAASAFDPTASIAESNVYPFGPAPIRSDRRILRSDRRKVRGYLLRARAKRAAAQREGAGGVPHPKLADTGRKSA